MSVAALQQPVRDGLAKMDDSRKRPAVIQDADDSAPPLKRHATMTNGAGADDKPDVPKFGTVNSPWQMDLEVSLFPLWSSIHRIQRERNTDFVDAAKGCHFQADARVQA
jgi:hypothetical protein